MKFYKAFKSAFNTRSTNIDEDDVRERMSFKSLVPKSEIRSSPHRVLDPHISKPGSSCHECVMLYPEQSIIGETGGETLNAPMWICPKVLTAAQHVKCKSSSTARRASKTTCCFLLTTTGAAAVQPWRVRTYPHYKAARQK